MKTKSKSSRVIDRYGMIEALESRIAPAALTGPLPTNAGNYKTVSVGSSLLLKAGDVLTTGSGIGGVYLLYVQAGEILVHTTDLNGNGQFDYNEITGISAGNGARFTSFVDIHGDIVTDLNPDGTLTDSDNNATNGRDGRVLLDANIGAIDLRSLQDSDFTTTATQSQDAQVAAHLAMSSYSIYGNIYAGGGLGLSTDSTSGLQINTSGETLQSTTFDGITSANYYQSSEPVIGSIYVGSAASEMPFNFGASGQSSDIHGNLLAFVPSPGEAGASVYNISAVGNTPFSIGTIEAGNGGFNASGGNVVNVALQGDNAGAYKVIAGNAGNGTIGQSGGSIINFSDSSNSGTFISEVVLQSGNGGTGLTGAGGNAGIINFNPAFNTTIDAHVVLNYGSGGDGYAKGGAGGGTTAATFITPEGKLTTAQLVVSTMHTPGSIGATQGFDFNGDGINDAIFATKNPNQVVVALGAYDSKTSLFGLKDRDYIYLNSPLDVESITVGNFTGAVNPVTHQPELDIAVAGAGPNYAGVEVYVSEYNTKTGAFEGFSDPLFSPLPSLSETTFSGNYYEYSATPITRLVAGDFSGNGVLGLAVLAEETVVPGTTHAVLFFLNGETDATHPGGTGYFYANFSNGNVPYIDLEPLGASTVTLVATALQQYTPNIPGSGVSNGHDVVVYADQGAKGVDVIDDSNQFGFGLPVELNGGAYGLVLPPGAKTPVQFTDYTFAITQDATNPTLADVVAVSKSPQGFLVVLGGDGAGDFNVISQPDVGIEFAYGGTFAPAAMVAIPNTVGTHQTANPIYSNVAILDYDTNGNDLIYLMDIFFDPNLGMNGATNGAVAQTPLTITPLNRNINNVAFDAYYPAPALNAGISGSGPGEFGFITGDPLQDYEGPGSQAFGITQPLPGSFGFFTTAPFKDAGYFLNGGNGGNSQSGSGGAGGSFGQSLTLTSTGGVVTGLGTLNIQYPIDPTFEGTTDIVAGNGGNGFTNGGAGGALVGISVTYKTGVPEISGDALLFAGNGGESLTGAGGNGGSESQLFVIGGDFFVAGNGGIGVTGGSGGSLLGNTLPSAITSETNNYNAILVLKAGDGATGIDGGGNGGGINAFVNEFPQIIYGPSGEVLNYVAGNAGDAVAGRAGTGGSVVNSSPYSLLNDFVGDMYLQGGSGGSGLYGGSGGGVSNFDQESTIKDSPYTLTVIGGAGGNATFGTGGTGGSVTNIVGEASGFGTLYTFNYSDPNDIGNLANTSFSTVAISYNRIVAGPGGVSEGGAGGAGGSVASINTASVAPDSEFAVAAGAGGQGLTAGGDGGSVTSAIVDAGSGTSFGKVVVIAGDGGTSLSGKPVNPNNPADVAFAIGGVDGAGGHGGGIIGFTQPLNTGTHVDLIAGNGGDTPNHSFLAGNATADNAGVGGSVENINVTGSIGNSDPNVAIKSYNDIFTGQTMQQFVDDFILGLNGNQANLSATIDDSVGNVGLVAGASGYVENFNGPGQPLSPAYNGVAGSVTNVFAENIMSMVAGNVDKVSLIQSLTDYGVTISGGILGANKIASSIPGFAGVLGQLNYIDPLTGEISDTPLPGGGPLIDGAFLAKNIRVIESIRDFQGTEVG
jgi:hypothetical protein